jgi:Amt family ammonium transporter
MLAGRLATGHGGLVYTGSFHQLGVQLLGVAVVGAWTFSASFGVLWAMKKLWGIRVHEEAETLGLDVSEHGMWGYPEFYIPVPGGYDTWQTPPWSRESPPPSHAAPPRIAPAEG